MAKSTPTREALEAAREAWNPIREGGQRVVGQFRPVTIPAWLDAGFAAFAGHAILPTWHTRQYRRASSSPAC